MGEDYKAIIEPCRKEEYRTLKLIVDDRPIYIHSRYDPASEAAKQVEKLKVGPGANYIIFGLGMGHHIRALLKRLKLEDYNKILVYEPNAEVYNLFMNDEQNKDLIEDIRIVILEFTTIYKTNEVLNRIYSSSSSYLNNYFFILPVYKEIYTVECRDFAANIKSHILLCYLSINTNHLFSDIWFKCTINNADFLLKSHSGKKLKDLYKGIPALIVSAGPSLAKNIELIREVKEKAVILSVDTAYKPLYTKQISPDLIISIDAQSMVLKKFEDTDILEKDLIACYTSATEVLRAHTGRKIAFSSMNVYIDERFDELGINLIEIEAGGSVACTALDVAYKTGADPIIFVGQDLAYTGKETHVAGTAFYNHTDTELDKDLEVPDINGDMVATTHNLNQYREWIEMYIHMYPDRKYIDATEGGAKINGAEIMTLRDVIDEYCRQSNDISGLKEQIFTPDNVSATREQYKGLLDHMKRSGQYLKKKLPEIKACKTSSEKIVKELNTNGFKRPDRIVTPYKRLKKLNTSLKNNEHYVDIILPLMALYREDAARTDHLRDKSLSEEKMTALDLEKYTVYYEALAEKIAYAVPLIEEAVNKNMEALNDGY